MKKHMKRYIFIWLMGISCLCYGAGRAVYGFVEKEEIRMESGLENRKEARAENGMHRAAKKSVENANGKTAGAGGARLASDIKKQTVEETKNQDELKKSEPVEEPDGQEPSELAAQQGTVQEVAQEVREFRRVEMDYLSDALFIGDSRTSTLYEYAGWNETDFFVKYGLTIWDVWDQSMDGETLEGMLSEKQYGKIYIMLGINELGSGTPESFAEQFQSVLERIRELQPAAVLFVESIMHVTAGKDAEQTYINNGEINARNEKLALLADGRSIFYLDENEVMDEPGTGTLKEEYSFDGVHLQVKYIDIWREFLLEHGI